MASGMAMPRGLATVLWLGCAAVFARTSAAQGVAAGATGPASVQRGVVLDRLVAVVNDAVVLESDVNEELRLVAFQPLRTAISTREQAIERLINRTLILQQARLQPEKEIADAQVDEQLNALRKEIPACKQYRCETEAGWLKFIKDQDFTPAELRARWRERMEVLRFIEERFRTGTTVSSDEIHNYYEKTLLPQYAQAHAAAPPLEAISNRIQEILLQQQVGNLLSDWLKSLRAQGTVRTIEPAQASNTGGPANTAKPSQGAP